MSRRRARTRTRTSLRWVLLGQLLPLPLVVTGHLGWVAAVAAYGLEATVVGVLHLLRTGGDPRWQRRRGDLVAALVLGVPAALGDGDDAVVRLGLLWLTWIGTAVLLGVTGREPGTISTLTFLVVVALFEGAVLTRPAGRR